MKKEVKFFICKHCGNLVTFIEESGAKIICCGEAMTQIIPNSQEAATEKHIPVVTADDTEYSVVVGSVVHPMTPEHYIKWIYMETADGGQIKYLEPSEEPKATFKTYGSKPVTFYAYCNIHGLWKIDIN